jgi:hypothetical protein
MKRYFSPFVTMLFLLTLVACEKKENKIYFEGGTNPVLSASITGNIPLAFANQDEEALTLAWTNPGYRLTTGISSHDVTYQVEIDTTGSNFTNPDRKILTLSNGLDW